ncbi:SDR family oxidoreductase [Marispirochaeta sp.]|uniref:SDR family oxidoreductase n=1 Tax=Marispirochaeta sp. TaxID=2038653 RepID=UPI0029C86CFA|nr:SDR family oxidoreductase [Marispirochaeta sp.]
MKVLFIGGTGNISTPCSQALLRRGVELIHLNRGSSSPDFPEGKVRSIHCDVNDEAALTQALEKESFDVVVDWIAFRPEQVRRDIRLFAGKTGHYIFISSASAYRKPLLHPVITESTPVANPFWDYSQQKILCERELMQAWEETGFPVTIVRPSHTYGESWIISSFGSRDYTVAGRMLAGKKIPVHGDGQSLWVLTHADDFATGFAGLVGNPQAIGEAYHITSDEILTWDRIHELLASALGVEADIVHLPLDFIEKHAPDFGPGLRGDKAYSVIFDNSKIRAAVPDFQPRICYAEGVRRSIEYLDEHPEKKIVDAEKDALLDRMIGDYLKLFSVS